MILVGTKVKFIAKPEHYGSTVFKKDEIYEVSEIAITGNDAPVLKFKNIDLDWIVSRFFEEA